MPSTFVRKRLAVEIGGTRDLSFHKENKGQMLRTDINFPWERKEILQEIVIMPEQVIKNNG